MNHLEALSREASRRASVRHMDWPAVVEACRTCARICRGDADACAKEPDAGALSHCVRADLDCAVVCNAAAQVLHRRSAPDMGVLMAVLKACSAAAVACAEEHDHFAETRAESGLCAEACRAAVAVVDEAVSDAGLRYV